MLGMKDNTSKQPAITRAVEKKRKIVKMSLIVVILFMVCWLPAGGSRCAILGRLSTSRRNLRIPFHREVLEKDRMPVHSFRGDLDHHRDHHHYCRAHDRGNLNRHLDPPV